MPHCDNPPPPPPQAQPVRTQANCLTWEKNETNGQSFKLWGKVGGQEPTVTSGTLKRNPWKVLEGVALIGWTPGDILHTTLPVHYSQSIK